MVWSKGILRKRKPTRLLVLVSIISVTLTICAWGFTRDPYLVHLTSRWRDSGTLHSWEACRNTKNKYDIKAQTKSFPQTLYQDNSMYATWHFLVSVILYQIKYFHYNNKMWVPQNNIKPSHESLTVAVVWFWIGTQSKGYLGREFPKEATWSGKFLPLRTPIRASYRTEQLEASFNLGRKVERAEDKRLTSITTQSNFSTGHMQRLRGHHRGSQLNAKESWKWTYKSYKM